MKRIIELSSLLVIMITIISLDINKLNKINTKKAELKQIAKENYSLAQADINKITVTTFDRYMVNKLDNKLIEKKQQEYNEYQ